MAALAWLACGTRATTAARVGLVEPNHPPELEIPPYQRVGVGQTVGFGLEVIDEEQDEIRVDLDEMPNGAIYHPRTLTVVWTASEDDRPAARFAVRVTETQRETGRRRVYRHAFGIEVVDDFQPRPVAGPLDPFTELVLTVHDVQRLGPVNQAWPLPRVLARAAELEVRGLPDKPPAVVDEGTLYRSLLEGLAETHQNPRVNPGSKAFDSEIWDHPESWRIMAVRFRLDKHWQELRLVYKNFRSPDGVYVMPRWRLMRERPGLTEADRRAHNQALSRRVFDAFFVPEGELREVLWQDEAAHGEVVAKLVTELLTAPGAACLAVPTEARLGGGSALDAMGTYTSGDGWAWSTMKPRVVDGQARLVNVPLKGFATAFAPDPVAARWRPVCASRFDPNHPAHVPGLEVLCRPDEGLVDLPRERDGRTESGLVDAVNLYRDHKRGAAVAELPLRDPRRDLAEENGMSCAECHTRAFGVHDRHDRSATDPRQGPPLAANKAQDRTFFVLAPGERWQPYMIDFQREQTCLAREAFREWLGVDVKLDCPLQAE